jgi:hypothetical protein
MEVQQITKKMQVPPKEKKLAAVASPKPWLTDMLGSTIAFLASPAGGAI